jgi:hypothetical protein
LQRYISSKAAGAPDRRQEREDTSLVISLKLDLLTNARVVDDAIRFVFEKTKKSSKIFPEDKSVLHISHR